MLLRHLVASGGGVTLLSPFWPPVFLLSIHWKEASGRCLRMRVNSLILPCQRLPGIPDCPTGPHSKNPLKLPAFFFPTVLMAISLLYVLPKVQWLKCFCLSSGVSHFLEFCSPDGLLPSALFGSRKITLASFPLQASLGASLSLDA